MAPLGFGFEGGAGYRFWADDGATRHSKASISNLLLNSDQDEAGGGEVVAERIRFADLVGDDGVEEAFVIVESGGTLGD